MSDEPWKFFAYTENDLTLTAHFILWGKNVSGITVVDEKLLGCNAFCNRDCFWSQDS